MNAIALVAELRARGVELRAVGDSIRFRPMSAVPPELVERLRAHKPEVLALLTANPERSSAAGAAMDLALIGAMSLEVFAQNGALLEVRVPWWPQTLWFVPEDRDKAAIVAEGIGAHRVWTAWELIQILTTPLNSVSLTTLTRAREAFDAEVVGVARRGAPVIGPHREDLRSDPNAP